MGSHRVGGWVERNCLSCCCTEWHAEEREKDNGEIDKIFHILHTRMLSRRAKGTVRGWKAEQRGHQSYSRDL